MKRVFKGVALVTLIAILVAPAVYADVPTGPPDPPEARVRIPTGVEGQQPATVFELFWAWLQVRIR
jgi:hypothetical protein